MTDGTQQPNSERPGLLPRGWAKVLLIAVAALLLAGYAIGLRARGPSHDEEIRPVRIRGVAPPEAHEP